MSTGLLLITHGRLGREMLDTVTMIMCQCPLAVRTIGVGGDQLGTVDAELHRRDLGSIMDERTQQMTARIP